MVVEWVAVPLLQRAVNALFDAGQALFKRRAGDSAEQVTADPTDLAPADRDRMLHQQVSELAFQSRALEIEALIEQIEIHQANLDRASKQAAMWGEALVPPIIANTIDSEVEKLRNASRRLRSLLDQLGDDS